MAWAVWERRTFGGEDWVVGTTSGASAEFIDIVRVWPFGCSGLDIGWVLAELWGRDSEEAFGVLPFGMS
jgi:hypothetical protein